MENNKQFKLPSEYSKASISKIQDQIICKVKFSPFSDYENVCFLPNNFEQLVKVFSKAFYPNDFIINYINSKYSQVIVHSDSTYNQILSNIYKDIKSIREVKFQIVLYNVNNEIEFNISKERINKEIKAIFENEKNIFIQTMKEIISEELMSKEFNNQPISSINRSIDESRFSKIRKIDIYNQNKHSEFSTSFSLSCKNFENMFIEDLEEDYNSNSGKTIYSMDNNNSSINNKNTTYQHKNTGTVKNRSKILGKSTKRYRNESPEEIFEINQRKTNITTNKNENCNSENNKNQLKKNIVYCC